MSSETIDQPAPRPSGIVTTDNNERVIPATRRADGTLRKERRVRPGFVPQEDVARYKNRWAQKKNEKRVLKKKEKRELEGDLNNENQQLVGNNELLEDEEDKLNKLEQIQEELRRLKQGDDDE
ncbi:16776_t:CDS:2 [Funneliformis geosporum]|uniref:16776_t:CDS:1 n=1 Tax=Funneliformis geosporum TaxID=1117311 RepID=A0A9W4WL54_9GLOM|nr:16776_t:CDS:2 [Funneliformis geosporum]